MADAAIKQMIEAGMAPKKATVVILGITFKENCPDTRNSKVVDIINHLKEFDINPIVADCWRIRMWQRGSMEWSLRNLRSFRRQTA